MPHLSKRSLILGAGAALITQRALAQPGSITAFRNPYAFPGGVPSFNSKHFILEGIGKSTTSQVIKCVAAMSTHGMMRLDQAAGPPTVSGAWTYPIDPIIGPSTNNGSAGSSSIYQLFNLPTTAATTYGLTYAAVFRINGDSAQPKTLVASSGATLIGIRVFNQNIYLFTSGSSATFNPMFGYNGSTSYPMFVAASIETASPFNWSLVLVQLQTGQLLVSNGTFSSIGNDASNTACLWGGGGGSDSFTGSIAAVAYLRTYLDQGTLMRWAAAPWDLWYPPTQQNLMASSLANPAGDGGAGLRALMGVGQ